MQRQRSHGIAGASPRIIIKLRHPLTLFVSASPLLLSACGTTGTTFPSSTAKITPLIASVALASAVGDVLIPAPFGF
jgi:hypothetical protein